MSPRLLGRIIRQLPLSLIMHHFVYIRTYNGEINIDGIKIFSWDEDTKDYDRDPENGRAYLLAKYDAVMNVVMPRSAIWDQQTAKVMD